MMFSSSAGAAVAIFAALLACSLLPSTHAVTMYSPDGRFSYDGDEYYLPGRGSQVVAGRPDSVSNPFYFYSSFNTNGATIQTIQSCVRKGQIKGLTFTWTDATSTSLGNMACGSDQRFVQFDVTSGERISKLQQQGDGGVLCKLYLETTIGSGVRQAVHLGATNCDGDNGPTTDVASGILAGAFGYQQPGTVVYQLGLLMLQNIATVTEDTSQFIDYPTAPPKNNYKGGLSLDASYSTVGQTGELTYTQESGYNSAYSETSTSSTFFGVSVGVKLSYAQTTPVSETGTEINIDSAYEYTKSTETTSSSQTYTATSTSFKLNVCCPPGVACTWSTYQGLGEITPADPATAQIATTVKFTTGKTVSYKSSTPWTGKSSYPTVYLVLQTNPPPATGTQVNDVADYCTAGAGRRLSASKVKAQEYEFAAIYNVPKTTKVATILDNLSKVGVTKKNVYAHNPFLWKVGVNGTVPAGKKLKYKFKSVAFVKSMPLKA